MSLQSEGIFCLEDVSASRFYGVAEHFVSKVLTSLPEAESRLSLLCDGSDLANILDLSVRVGLNDFFFSHMSSVLCVLL